MNPELPVIVPLRVALGLPHPGGDWEYVLVIEPMPSVSVYLTPQLVVS